MTTRETFVGTIRGLRVFHAGAQLIVRAGYRAGLRAKLGRHGFRYREPDPMGPGFWERPFDALVRATLREAGLVPAGMSPAEPAPRRAAPRSRLSLVLGVAAALGVLDDPALGLVGPAPGPRGSVRSPSRG